MWRLIYFIPIWDLVFIITFPMHLLGFVMIPLACICKAYFKSSDNEDKPKDGATYHFTWPFMWPWDNDTSDGIACRNYYQSSFKKYGYLDMIVTTFMWSAIRNPINNLKRLLSPKYDFSKLKHVGGPPFTIFDDGKKHVFRAYQYKANFPCWYLIWQGPFAGFYWSFKLLGKHRYIKIGYKLRTYESESEIPNSQKDGVGFTFRIIPKELA